MELLNNIYQGGNHYGLPTLYHRIVGELSERKRGQHLQREERGAIQALKRQGLSNRAIWAARLLRLETSCDEVHRHESQAKVVLRATVYNGPIISDHNSKPLNQR